MKRTLDPIRQRVVIMSNIVNSVRTVLSQLEWLEKDLRAEIVSAKSKGADIDVNHIDNQIAEELERYQKILGRPLRHGEIEGNEDNSEDDSWVTIGFSEEDLLEGVTGNH